MAGQALLEVRNLSVNFGGLAALSDVSLSVYPGEIVGLIGPNGAGKTTLFNCLSRLQTYHGSILIDGRDLQGRQSHDIAALGIGRTFQNLALFRSMTVLENVLVGQHTQQSANPFQEALTLRPARRQEAAARQRAEDTLAWLGIGQLRDAPAAMLPYGSQKGVELARALVGQPRLLLLDEPAAGSNDSERTHLAGLIRRIRDEFGITVLLVEHDMGLVMELCDRLTVLDFGRVIAEGPPAAVAENPAVIEAYLGEKSE